MTGFDAHSLMLARTGTRSAIAAVILMTALSQSAPAWAQPLAKAQQKVLCIKQTSMTQGALESFIYPNNIRIDYLDRHTTMVARAPQWQIEYRDNNRKVFWLGDVKDFKPPFITTLAMFRPSDPSFLLTISSKTAKVKTLDTIEWQLEPLEKQAKSKTSWKALMIQKATMHVLPPTAYDFPANIIKAVDQCLGLPIVKGFPIDLQKTTYHGKVDKELDVGPPKQMAYSDSLYATPAGYKRLGALQNVINDPNMDNALGEFMTDRVDGKRY
ncbi:MAG: hypothetical protein J0H83_15765 [Candidatus Melainabacteria bacterium]|nr:hypothetical protein [Candidatus Melainabacteria bacterium]